MYILLSEDDLGNCPETCAASEVRFHIRPLHLLRPSIWKGALHPAPAAPASAAAPLHTSTRTFATPQGSIQRGTALPRLQAWAYTAPL